VDFTDLQGNVTLLGRFFAEELETALANSGSGIDLVDRTRLQLLIQENKLASKEGLIDPATARKLGNIAGVQVLITGTITPLDDNIRLSVKALDTEDARVIAAVSRNVQTTPAISKLLNQGPMANTPSTPHQQLQVVDYRQYRFELQSCERSGNAIECNLTITDRSGDQDFSIYSSNCSNGIKSRLIDGQGREARPQLVKLGSHQNDSTWCVAKSTLVSGVPTSAKLSFANVAPDISSIALLEIMCNEGNGDSNPFAHTEFKVQLRNIPVSEKRY
jgi:hypothetical protein